MKGKAVVIADTLVKGISKINKAHILDILSERGITGVLTHKEYQKIPAKLSKLKARIAGLVAQQTLFSFFGYELGEITRRKTF